MKLQYLIFLGGSIFAIIGLLLNFASAPKYDYIFATIVTCDLLALGCLVYLMRIGEIGNIMILFPFMVVLYTMIDVALRFFWGLRALDFIQ